MLDGSLKSRQNVKIKQLHGSDVSIMAEEDALFGSPLQSTSSKTSITQQRFHCPTHQDAREIHTSVHLKVG